MKMKNILRIDKKIDYIIIINNHLELREVNYDK